MGVGIMKLSVNERIKDLRIDHMKMKQKEFSQELNIPQTTYADYEQDGTYVPVEVIIKIAKFCQVSTDYIVGLSDTMNPINIDINSLHLNDKAIKTLQENNFNSIILSELISDSNFKDFLRDLEIYVDGYVEEGLHQYNTYMDYNRYIIEKNVNGMTKEEIETDLKSFDTMRMAQKDYYMYIFAKDIIPIADNIKEKYKDSASTSNVTIDMNACMNMLYKLALDKKDNENPFVTLKNVIVDATSMALKTANINEDIQKETLQTTDSTLNQALFDSPIIEPNARKRRDNKNKNDRKQKN